MYICPVQVDYAMKRSRIASKPMQAPTLVFIPKTIDTRLVARPRRPKIHLFTVLYCLPCLSVILYLQIFFQKVLTHRIKQCLLEPTRRDNPLETYLARDVEPSRVSVLH